MIIVAGHLRVEPRNRETYLRSCIEVARIARATPGCIDFRLSPDPIDDDRINVFEQWESVEAVEAFRGADSSSDLDGAIIEAVVLQHEIASSTPLT